MHMSAIGGKADIRSALHMSAFDPKRRKAVNRPNAEAVVWNVWERWHPGHIKRRSMMTTSLTESSGVRRKSYLALLCICVSALGPK